MQKCSGFSVLSSHDALSWRPGGTIVPLQDLCDIFITDLEGTTKVSVSLCWV